MQTARIRHSSFSSWYTYHEMGVSHDLCYRESHIGAFWSCFGCLHNFMKTIKWAAFSLLRSQINRPALTNSGHQRNDMLWEHSKQSERRGGLGLWHRRFHWIWLTLAWIVFYCMKCLIKKKKAAASGKVLGFFGRPKRSRNFWSGVFFFFYNYYFFQKAPHKKMHK